MGRIAATKYKYGALMIEVSKRRDVSPLLREFLCLVRGFGHNSDIPRKEFVIQAETNAKAARIALEKYNRKID